MSLAMFIIAFAAGSAAIAVWIAVRFPRFAPADIAHVIVHVIACGAIAQFAAPAAMQFARAHGSA